MLFVKNKYFFNNKNLSFVLKPKELPLLINNAVSVVAIHFR